MTLTIGDPTHFTIQKIKDDIDKFEFNRIYQRSDEAWSEPKKQKLLDSILQGLSIGVLFIKEKSDIYEVLDGQQRIQTLKEFFEGDLRTAVDQKGFKDKDFHDLEADSTKYSEFMGFKVWYIPVYGGNDEELSDIFLRLQEGTPLNPAEKLNAMFGNMRNFVVGASEHPVFKHTSIRPIRFAHRFLVAQFCLIEKMTDFTKKVFPSLRFPEMVQLYNKYSDDKVPRSLRSGLIGTLDFLNKSLDHDMMVVRKKSDLIMLYALTSYVRKKFVIRDLQDFNNFVTNFFVEVEQVDVDDKKVDNPYTEFKVLRTKGSTSKTIRKRFYILLSDFKKSMPKTQAKDPQRFFNWGQKFEIYYRKNNRICQYCKNTKPVSWKEATFDHIIRHGKGAKTTVANGQLLHKKCHLELEKKRDEQETSKARKKKSKK